MKYLIITFALFTSLVLNAQKMSYDEWRKEANDNIRLHPKYNNAEKSKGQLKADQQLIKESLETHSTLEKASEYYVSRGFDYLYAGDLKLAMYRFNQAWLLNPKNENAFWGFGGVYFTYGDFEKALTQYEEGLKINPKSSNLLTDKASVYLGKYDSSQDLSDINQAIELFKTSLAVDSKNQNTLYKISICYFIKEDCKNALIYYDDCQNLAENQFLKNIQTNCFKNVSNLKQFYCNLILFGKFKQKNYL